MTNPRWQPVTYGTAGGDLIELWRSTPPPGLSQRLRADPERLRAAAIDAAAACGAALLDIGLVTVDGSPAIKRVEQLVPADGWYAASLVVAPEDEVSVEISVICGDSPARPGDGGTGEDAATRAVRYLDDLTPRIWLCRGRCRLCAGSRTRTGPRAELARARRAAGLDQAEFAAGVGVSKAAVSQWERGRNGVDVKYFPAIAKVLGIPVAQVACLVDGPNWAGGPAGQVWHIRVQDLPARPCTALTGPAVFPWSRLLITQAAPAYDSPCK